MRVYIPTQEGWLYLAVMIFQTSLRDSVSLHDIFSRKVVAWSMSHSLHTSLVNKALLMTIQRRNPKKKD